MKARATFDINAPRRNLPSI